MPERKIDIILAVGGGSVIDSAKTMASGVLYNRDVWGFFMGGAELKERIPVGVVLTIPASGSEPSDSTVGTNEDGMYEKSFNSELLRPEFAILNPEITFTLPLYQTVCGSSDITVYIIERYFTRVSNVELTDRLCKAALKTVTNNTPEVLREPENYTARAESM